VFVAPVMTDTSVLEILGTERVEGLAVERSGRRLDFACDGVVFTGKFVPEATLAEASGLMLDQATRGPVVDQYGRCSWPEVFCAGNGLRGVEGSAWCFREGRAAARNIVAYLAGILHTPENMVPVTADGALKYVYPQRLSLSPVAGRPIPLYARATREMRGMLSISADGRAVWKKRIHVLPERRVEIQMPPLSQLGNPRAVSVRLTET